MNLKEFWRFIWKDDSLLAHITFAVLALIFLKITYPVLFYVTGNTIGINDVVAVVSGSMVHDSTINQTFYEYLNNYGITNEQISQFPHLNGLNPGDLLVLWKADKPEDIKLGDVIVFNAGNLLIIHRVIDIRNVNGQYYFTTKGDHNTGSLPAELNISFEQIKGIAKQRIPFLGIPKTILTQATIAVQSVIG